MDSLKEACDGVALVIFVTPRQFLRDLQPTIRDFVDVAK
jgi:hypothetical protein